MDNVYLCIQLFESMNQNTELISASLNALSAQEGLRWISNQYPDSVRFSSALGMEDQVITHMIGVEKLDIKIFTLDTGRLFQESYDLLDLTQRNYQTTIHTYFPNTASVEKLVTEKGPNSFYESVENRKECCHIRKVEPLKRALQGATIWVTGVRAEQSANRHAMKLVEWDDQHQVIKYNPLLLWTEKEILEFVESNKIPVNVLHKKSYPSIGCAPCTRAIVAGEDFRAGRWWWESSNKECGLHE